MSALRNSLDKYNYSNRLAEWEMDMENACVMHEIYPTPRVLRMCGKHWTYGRVAWMCGNDWT